MPVLNWTAPALEDLRSIDAWLTEHRPADFAVRTLVAIRMRAKFLEDFPHGGRPSPGGTRILRVFETPYLILYRIEGEQVSVLRVQHEREDWQLDP